MTNEQIKYKLNEVRMMINDGEHIEEQGIIVECIKALEKQPSEDCVSRKAVLDILSHYAHNFGADTEIKALSPVTPIRKAPREDITEDEVKINMLELAFNQVNEQAEGIEILTDKYRLIFKAETRSNTVGWSSLENVREKVERGDSDDSN